jgi:hypothetical protein
MIENKPGSSVSSESVICLQKAIPTNHLWVKNVFTNLLSNNVGNGKALKKVGLIGNLVLEENAQPTTVDHGTIPLPLPLG